MMIWIAYCYFVAVFGIVFVYYHWSQICIPEGDGLEYVVKEMATYIEALISQSKM